MASFEIPSVHPNTRALRNARAQAHITKPVLTGLTSLHGEALPLMAPASSLVSPGVRLSCHGRLGKPDGGAETRKRS